MYRTLIHSLSDWKSDKKHKPLLLRGARQVGKTHLVREFAKQFDLFIELNLERQEDREFFEVYTVDSILTKIQLERKVEIQSGKSALLFIDEIQEVPQAIAMLRYFYEDRPDIHVIAAGSLLEFAFRHVSNMPVGRVQFIYLHPLNFAEYLHAIDNKPAVKAFETVPLPAIAHSTLLKYFNEYAMLGGMPEILNDYLSSGKVSKLTAAYRGLWEVYLVDVEKYAANESERKVIAHIIKSSSGYLERIKFEKFGNSNYRSREVGEAFRTLDKAKLIRLIYPSTSIEPPIRTDLRKRPRLQFLDTGMLTQSLELQGEMIGLKDLLSIHRGRIIEHLVNQELISIQEDTDYRPNFWVREDKQSMAEVDIIYRHGKHVIPIEVKSGAVGKLRSLHQFIDRSPHPYAVRMYAGNLNVERHSTPAGTEYLLLNLPYFLGTKLPEYLAWFTENHTL